MDYSKSIRSRVVAMEVGAVLTFADVEATGSTLRNYAATIGPLMGRQYSVHKNERGHEIIRTE